LRTVRELCRANASAMATTTDSRKPSRTSLVVTQVALASVPDQLFTPVRQMRSSEGRT
jgi:hypothetical protein